MREKTIAGRLADYGLALRFDTLPDDAVHETKRRYIDALGCALGASACPPVRAARTIAPEVSGGAA